MTINYDATNIIITTEVNELINHYINLDNDSIIQLILPKQI